MNSDLFLIVYNFCRLRLHLETDFVIVLLETYDVPTLYEGDMALTDEQVLALEKNKTRPPNSSQDQDAYTRGAIGNAAYLWPNGIIPFVISENIGNIYIQRSFYKKKGLLKKKNDPRYLLEKRLSRLRFFKGVEIARLFGATLTPFQAAVVSRIPNLRAKGVKINGHTHWYHMYLVYGIYKNYPYFIFLTTRKYI